MKYTLTIRALPGNWKGTPTYRLKMFLKAMKRGWGFSCESISEIKDPDAKQFACADCGKLYIAWSDATTCSCTLGQHEVIFKPNEQKPTYETTTKTLPD